MARQPGTIDPEELRRQLGTLITRAAWRLGEVRDAVVRTSQTSRIKLDAALVRRERDRMLRELGELTLRLAEEGHLELPGELQPILAAIREVDQRLAEHAESLRAVDALAEGLKEADRAAALRAREVEASLREGKYEAPEDAEEQASTARKPPRKPRPKKND